MRHSQQSISGDESCGQAEEAAGQSDAAHACAESLQAEHADDALGQRAAVGGHREDWSAAPFFHQREGARVFDGDQEVGLVRRLLALPSCECLEVARDGAAGDLLVPLVRDAIRSVDVAAGRIDVDLRFLGEAPPA